MYEVTLVLGSLCLKGSYNVYCLQMINAVWYTHDGGNELGVVCFKLADGTSTYGTCVYVQGNGDLTIFMNDVNTICAGEISIKQIEVLLEFF